MQSHSKSCFGLAMAICLPGLLPAQPVRCTQETIAGTYAMVTQGTMLMPSASAGQVVTIPAAALAIVSIDSTGAVSGAGVMSMGGEVSQPQWPGTIQVNLDCTAAVNWTGGPTGAAVILDEGQSIRSIMVQSVAGKGIVQGEWRRISRVPATVEPAQCSPADVHGVYASSYQGIQIGTPPGATQPVAMPTVMVSVASIDYQGQISGGGTMSLAGDPVPFQVSQGTVTVNADCSAVTEMALDAGPLSNTGKGWMVVLDGGDELWSLPTESHSGKTIAFGTWKRISPIPVKK